jgi:hypothetical protein
LPTPRENRTGGEPGGDFAATFARKVRTPIGAFVPGRRAWLGAGAGAAAVLVLAGIGTGLTRLDFGSGGKAASAGALPSRLPVSAPHTTPGAAPSTPAGTTTAPASARTPATSPTPAPAAAATGGQDSGSALLASIASSPTPAAGGTPRPAATPAAASASTGYLSAQTSVSSGGNAYWSQSVVTVTTTAPLGSLKVAVRIIQTGGVASTGTWSSAGGSAAVAVSTTGTAVNYEFTLKPGVVLQPGHYVFEVQYNHDAGTRSTARDLYAVVATASPSGTQEGTDGHF